MASMYEDIEKYRSPMSVQKTALEPIDTAYMRAKEELDEMHNHRSMSMEPMSMEQMKKEERLWEICSQFERARGNHMGTATVDRDDIAVAADRETEM